MFSAEQQLDFLLQYFQPAVRTRFPDLKLLSWDFNKSALPLTPPSFQSTPPFIAHC